MVIFYFSKGGGGGGGELSGPSNRTLLKGLIVTNIVILCNGTLKEFCQKIIRMRKAIENKKIHICNKTVIYIF